MKIYILISLLALIAIWCLGVLLFRRSQKPNCRSNKNVCSNNLNKPEYECADVQEWIKKENPYQHMTATDKELLPKIGTTINKSARKGEENEATCIYDRLIKNNVLKEDLVVFRGVVNQDYERRLAKEQGLSNEYLYYNGYIFCSLNDRTYYWESHKTKMIISLPAGTHYLYTGEYSNTPESNEIILDKNSILRIDNEKDYNGDHYMKLTLVKEKQ